MVKESARQGLLILQSLRCPAHGSKFSFCLRTMKQCWRIPGRNFILGLMLLLAVAASLISFSYDADTQDDIPPVTVELKFLPQTPTFTQSSVQSPSSFLPLAAIAFDLGSSAVSLPVAAAAVPQASFKLSPTLRC